MQTRVAVSWSSASLWPPQPVHWRRDPDANGLRLCVVGCSCEAVVALIGVLMVEGGVAWMSGVRSEIVKRLMLSRSKKE